MVLLASGMQCKTFTGFQFSSGGIIGLPRFDMAMAKAEVNIKPVLAAERRWWANVPKHINVVTCRLIWLLQDVRPINVVKIHVDGMLGDHVAGYRTRLRWQYHLIFPTTVELALQKCSSVAKAIRCIQNF
uniref:Uncharacterized protein n=1 Tax=Nelumbo nucifera TaxID=4432 RepID=A0A822YAQ8_NELNU|nr:TPA_asm: hypothetical protein HUJ06_029563 [Nelumbo nucifera]